MAITMTHKYRKNFVNYSTMFFMMAMMVRNQVTNYDHSLIFTFEHIFKNNKLLLRGDKTAIIKKLKKYINIVLAVCDLLSYFSNA